MIKMTLAEIENEIERLQNLRKELLKEEVARFKKQAKQNVGRCFIVGGRYTKIVDVPQERYEVTGLPVFNRYQYPALVLGYDDEEDIVPFHMDTIFSGIWEDGCNSEQEAIEITQDEFQTEFEYYMRQFQDMTSAIADEQIDNEMKRLQDKKERADFRMDAREIRHMLR